MQFGGVSNIKEKKERNKMWVQVKLKALNENIL